MIRISLVQMNPVVGDLKGNAERILEKARQARGAGADLIVFPELVLPGYPPEDLLLKRQFVRDQMEAFGALAPRLPDAVVLLGLAYPEGEALYNAAAIVNGGEVAGFYKKIQLPNYGVFDEKRYFDPGDEVKILQVGDATVGVQICEDLWVPDCVTEAQSYLGDAEVIVNLSSSPYHYGKRQERLDLLRTRAGRTLSYICYCNLVGGQDELLFDGESFILGPGSDLLAVGRKFEEDIVTAVLDPRLARRLRKESPSFKRDKMNFTVPLRLELLKLSGRPAAAAAPGNAADAALDLPPLSEEEEVYTALVLGIRDYVRKNGFTEVVLGLSGGVDSALVAVLAADALGAEAVHALYMPSRYSSDLSRRDAEALAGRLGIDLQTVSIERPFTALLEDLKPLFRGRAPDETEENLQARVRGMLVMAQSNKFGWLVLTTGNKSEFSVGYCTLYGDTAGGFAVLKDVPKTLVFRLCRWRNARAGQRELIPESILTRPPSAELKPDQTDQDSLPPYAILDEIIRLYVEEDRPVQEILDRGLDPAVVRKVVRLIDRTEYKRRQTPPGIKITHKAFGRDRRMPITNRYHSE